MKRTKTVAGNVALAIAAGLLLVSGTARAEGTIASRDGTTLEWLERMGQYFEANPELKTKKGSGWKPYNRFKWFYEQRMVNGEEIPSGARWRAWEQKNEIARSGPEPRNTWFSLGPTNLSGRMLDLEFDPVTTTTVYAASAGGGLWKSVDNGASWFPLTDEIPTLGVGAVCVLPSNPNVVIIGTGEATPNIDQVGGVGILRSTDGGLTWSTTSLSYDDSSGHGFHCMEVNPLTDTILAGAIDGLWRSSDAGLTWTNVRPEGGGTDYYDVAWKPGSATNCYTVKGNAPGSGVKYSTDDGLTFTTSLGNPFVGAGKSKIAVTPANSNFVYAHFSNDDTSIGTYLSTNSGLNFTQVGTTDIIEGQGWYNLMFAADPNNANRLIGGGVPMYRSVDGGVSWGFEITGPVHVDFHAIKWKPGSPDEVWVGNDGGIWFSTNDGTNWTSRNSNLVTYQFYDICVAQTTTTFVMGGTQDNGTDRWTGSTNWLNGLGADGMVCNIDPENDAIVYGEIQFADHRKSTNSGSPNSWFGINNGIIGNGAWVGPVAQNQTAGNTNTLFTATSLGTFRTTNGGTSWQQVSPHNPKWFDVSTADGDVVWSIAGFEVRLSTNGGDTWAVVSPFGFPISSGTKILGDPHDANSVYATFSGYAAGVAHVARSTDLGATWTNITANLPDVPVNAIAADNLDPSRVFIGTDVGVWETTDGGSSWHPFETGFPNAVVEDLEIQKSGRKLVAGTHGRGAWEVDISSSQVGVEVATPTSMNLMLDPPSPNPASRETTLRFAAKHAGEVTLTVYDVAGRQVSQPVRAPVGDGIIRMVPWLTDDVPSGVYFAVLKAGSEQLSRKIVVAK